MVVADKREHRAIVKLLRVKHHGQCLSGFIAEPVYTRRHLIKTGTDAQCGIKAVFVAYLTTSGYHGVRTDK